MKKILLLIILALTLIGCTKTPEAKVLSTPTNLNHQQNIISFDAVSHATSYIVDINGEEIEITTTTYTIELFGEVTVKVKARAAGYQDSSYSNELVFSIPLSLPDVRYNYSIHSSFDLFIYTFQAGIAIDNITSSTTSISTNDYTFINNQLVFKSTYLKSLDPKLHEFVVSLGTSGQLNLAILITETQLPYLISNNTIDFDSNDITLNVELFGGTIVGLSGNSITSSDYTVSGSSITLHSTFINQYFSTHPNETTLSIKYDLRLGDSYVFGYLFIKK